MKRFLLIQCLFVEGVSIANKDKIFGMEASAFQSVCKWFGRNGFMGDRCELKVIDGMSVYMVDSYPPRETVVAFRQLVQQLQLESLKKLCDYVLKPSYASFMKVQDALSQEDKLIAERVQKSVLIGMDNMTEAMYEEYRNNISETIQLFSKGDIKGIMRRDKCVKMHCSVLQKDDVLDNLMENDNLPEKHIFELDDNFLGNYMFTAWVQVSCYNDVSKLSEKTAGYILTIMEEMQKREMYSYHTSVILTLFLASDYRGELYRRVPEVYIDEKILEREMRNISTLRERHRFVNNDVIGKTVKHIIQRAVSQQFEISYLKFLSILLETASHPTIYVNEFELKELEKIGVKNEWSKLAVLLTAMCIRENGDVKTILRKLLQLHIPRVTIYSIAISILINCDVKNAEMLMVAFYLALEQEEFEERQEMRTRLLNRMYENRCDGERTAR